MRRSAGFRGFFGGDLAFVLAIGCLLLAAVPAAWGSLSGSNVTMTLGAGGDICYDGAVPGTYCFLSESRTDDMEFRLSLWLRFPADWTITNAYVQGSPYCTNGGEWDVFGWAFESGPNEIRIDHPAFQAVTDACYAYYCVDAIPGAAAGDAPVSWYYAGDGYGAPPYNPASSDAYTPASMAATPPDETVSAPATVPGCPVNLTLDDGISDNQLGNGGTQEFIFLNRFTPAAAQYPFLLDGARIFFASSGMVNIGDPIRVVVYENATGSTNPAVGANLLASFPATVTVVDGWGNYPLPSPLPIAGPGDLLIGVIALATPGTGYWPASLDQTVSQQRSWIGVWNASPPPDPAVLPPDGSWAMVDSIYPGNWMIRAYGRLGGSAPRILFGTTGNAEGTSTLVTLDASSGALVTTIGAIGYLVNGLDYDPVSGKLYATTSWNDALFPSGLITIDPATGAGTPIGTTGLEVVLNVRADAAGNLFAWTEDTDDLVTINPTTGLATVVGTAASSPRRMAWRSMAREPSSW